MSQLAAVKAELQALYPGQVNVTIQGTSLIVTVAPANLAEWRKWRDRFGARIGARTGDDITIPAEYQGTPITLTGQGVGLIADTHRKGANL